jgi:hypothetical protein
MVLLCFVQACEVAAQLELEMIAGYFFAGSLELLRGRMGTIQ